MAGKKAIFIFAVVGLVVAAGGWYWQATLQCRAIVVANAVHAAQDEIRDLSGVETGQLLYAIDPAVIRDRVRRHPWVEDASIHRVPTGRLTIEVYERHPRMLVVGKNNHPTYYLDHEGYQMPVVHDSIHNVPLLRGWHVPYEPAEAVQDSTIRTLLQALEQTPAAEQLISEIIVQQEHVSAQTIASPDGRSIAVRIGRGNYEDKLTRLAAFWEQAVNRYDRQYRQIDLRFADQVVVRETS
jgi:cell division protein FtsQ